MKKRIFSLLLALALMGSTVCAAAELSERSIQASLYLDAYSISVTPKGGGKMSVTYIVYGTKTMDCIGAQKIVVEEWDGSDWSNPVTYTAEKNPEFYAYNAAEHAGSFTFYGIPGLQYHAILTAYAELDGGSDAKPLTSLAKTCK